MNITNDTLDNIVYLAEKARDTNSIYYLKQLSLMVEAEIVFRCAVHRKQFNYSC